jgi:hypothetical protein
MSNDASTTSKDSIQCSWVLELLNSVAYVNPCIILSSAVYITSILSGGIVSPTLWSGLH